MNQHTKNDLYDNDLPTTGGGGGGVGVGGCPAETTKRTYVHIWSHVI